MVSFNEIPAGARTPFTFVEFDSSQSQAGPGVQEYSALVVGQKLSSGAVAELVPSRFTREDQVAAAFGSGSMLHSMARALFAQTRGVAVTFVALDDPSGGTAGTQTVTFAASSPKSGTVAIYIGGRRYAVPCTTASTANTLAAALAATVSADTFADMTASVTNAVVTLTARHAGVAAAVIDVRHSHLPDESLPLGVTVAVAAGDAGAGDVDLGEVIAVLGDEQYHVIANPYTDGANLTALETELASRFGPERQLEGVAFSATAGNASTATTLGNSRNSAHISILSSYKNPTPTWAIAAAIAGRVAASASIDPARPFQTLVLSGVLAPKVEDRFTRAERDLLLHDGIATSVANAAGQLAIERLITTYQTSAQGAADTAYLDVTTLLTLSRLRFDFRTTFQTKFPRHKLANDGTRYAAGQAVVTPSVARAEVMSLARSWERNGLVENVDKFKDELIVVRNESDPTRLDFYLPPDLVNGLRVFAAQIGFGL